MITLLAVAFGQVELEVVAEGLESPADLAFVGGALVVAAKDQLIVLDGKGGQTPWMAVPCATGERCRVTGVAADAAFKKTGRVFVAVQRVAPDGKSVRVDVDAWRTDARKPAGAEPLGRETTLLSATAGSTDHVRADLAVSPDGDLYVALGDAARAGDPDDNGQNRATHWGAVHRLDPDGTAPYAADGNPGGGGLPTVFAWGVRDPYVAVAASGDVIVADRGRFEHELSLAPAGANLGWRRTEGSVCREKPCPDGLKAPFLTMTRQEAGDHWRGGVVPAKGPWAGKVLFATANDVRAAVPGQPESEKVVDLRGFASAITASDDGQVYAASMLTGKVYRLKPAGP